MEIDKKQFWQIVQAVGVKRVLAMIPVRVVQRALGLATFGDVAKRLGMPVPSLHHYHRRGDLPAPAVKIKNSRFYTADQVRQIVKSVRTRPRPGPVCKLDAGDRAEIRRAWLAGARQVDLSEKYEVSQGTISRVIRGR